MSIENPATILVDANGMFVGVPNNVLYTSGSVTGSVGITGAVTVANFPAVQPVTGSLALSEPAHVVIDSSVTLPVSGNLTVNVGKSSAATASSTPAITFSQQVLAANSNRLGAVFVNDAPATAYLLFGSGSQFNSWTYRMFPYTTIELNEPVYTGVVSAIWNVATGSMRVTELT